MQRDAPRRASAAVSGQAATLRWFTEGLTLASNERVAIGRSEGASDVLVTDGPFSCELIVEPGSCQIYRFTPSLPPGLYFARVVALPLASGPPGCGPSNPSKELPFVIP